LINSTLLKLHYDNIAQLYTQINSVFSGSCNISFEVWQLPAFWPKKTLGNRPHAHVPRLPTSLLQPSFSKRNLSDLCQRNASNVSFKGKFSLVITRMTSRNQSFVIFFFPLRFSLNNLRKTLNIFFFSTCLQNSILS